MVPRLLRSRSCRTCFITLLTFFAEGGSPIRDTKMPFFLRKVIAPPPLILLVNVELLLMHRWIALHDHGSLGQLFHFRESPAVVGFQRFCYLGIDPQQHIG